MARLAILNMFIGFCIVAVAAAGGPFIATILTEGYLRDEKILTDWLLTLQMSAHGHTNLFGMLHIIFGLTLPYSIWSGRTKKWQTVGIAAGAVAMGPVMLVRAWLGPSESMDPTEIAIGALLSLSLLAISSHAVGLGAKYFRA